MLIWVRLAGMQSHLSRLEISLLGRFEVSVDGKRIAPQSWPSLRASHLVQMLSLQPHYRMPRDVAIDALWPQLSPESGAANLRKAMHHSRQALGRHDGIVLHAGELVLWSDRPLIVDSTLFETHALMALRQKDPTECAAVAGEYGGDLLPGARYEPWAESRRERLRALFLDLLRASEQWEQLARQEPTDEVAHRALMEYELQIGNRSAALRWYSRLRESLEQTLGVTPEPRTEAVYERCIADLQAVGPTFVGRAQTLGQLTAWLNMAPTNRPGAIALRGPAGIGKTALCRELGIQARRRGWTTVSLQAVQTGETYGATAAIAEQIILADRNVLDHIGAPARAVLALLSPLALPASKPQGPLGRHQVVGAMRRLLLAAAPTSDVLLQVDDAHVIDDADVDILVQLAVAGAPLCLVLASRPIAASTALSKGISRLQRTGVLQTIDLPPMDKDESRRLVIRALPKPLPDATVDYVVQAADGNPFALIELARCTVDQTGRLPGNAAEAITERLCDVPDDALALLRWLALGGGDWSVRTIESLATLALAAPFTGIDQALEAGALVFGNGRYRFRHELLRQALLDQIPPHRRIKMHREIAVQLAERDAAPANIARHWLDGDRPRDAIPWLLAAARDAIRLAAFSDALRHLTPILATEKSHPEALRLRAEALDAMGDPGAMAAYRLAADVADATESHNLLANAALAQVKQGDPKGALLALQGLQPSSVNGRLNEALAYAGAAALGAGDPAVGTTKAAIARRLAIESGDTESLVIASWAQAAAAHARGQLHQSVWADLQETRHVPHLALRVFDGHLCITQRFLYGSQPYASVIQFAEAVSVEAQRLGAARGHAFGITLRGEAEWLAGNLVAAREHLTAGARLHRAIGGSVGEALSLQRLAEVALFEGKQNEARAMIDDALDVARQTDVGFHLLDRIYGTRINLHYEDPEAALHVMEDASESVRGPRETCPGCRITFAVPAAIAAARAGELDLAEKHEAQCAYLADVVMRLPAWYAAHAEVCGHIAAARNSGSVDAANYFAEAAKGFRQAGQPLDAHRCGQLASGVVGTTG